MKRMYFAVLACLMAIGIMVAISYAWFLNTEFVEPDISGYSISAYFGGGDGSEDNPFEIKNQRHLYNLAWLQYLGYFNKPGSGNKPDESKTTLTQYSFVLNVSSGNLDMTSWNLPPIGTTIYPFIGSFNGNGNTISNLNTTNDFSEFGQRHPSSVTPDNFANCEIIGFIGSIGAVSGSANPEHTSYSYSSSANSVTNVILNESTVKTISDETLIGAVAGYVNGEVEDVGVKSPRLYITSSNAVNLTGVSNISDYSVVGYAEEQYTALRTTSKMTVYNPTTTYSYFTYYGMGNSDNWGGSIDMLSLYNRYKNRGSTALTTYVSDEIHYYNQDGTTYQASVIINSFPDPSSKNTYSLDRYYYASYNDGSGAYLTMGAPGSRGYDYLTGLYKTVINIEVKSTTVGYKIKAPNINNYLGVSSTRQGNTTNFNVTLETEGTTNADTATAWIQSSRNGGGNHLYTYNKDDGYQYYLNATPTSLTISDIGTTAWQYDANYGYYITQNNVNYYLRYINNEWTISNKLSYLITDNRENYLSRNNTAVTNVPDYTQATRWIFENENGVNGSSGIIYDENDTSYKLIINNNGNLACTNSNNNLTSWSNNGNNLYSDNKFIAYYNNAWRIYTENAKYIKYGNYYLTLNTNGTINNTETDQDNASSWTFSNNDTNPKGYLTTTIDETTYYLSFNNSNTNKLEIVTSQAQAIQWANDGDGAYYTYNNVKYYLQYKNSIWQAAIPATKTEGYYISFTRNNITYYLTYNDDVSSNPYVTSNLNEATIWNYDSNNRVYIIVDDITYYLRASGNSNGATIGLETRSDRTRLLVKYNNYIRNSSSTGYYLIYYQNTLQTRDNQNNYRFNTWTNATVDDIESTPRPSIITNTNNVTYICDLRDTNPNMTRTSATTNIYYRNPDKEVPSVFNYVPLNTNDDYSVKNTNTGYIIAGGHSGVTANNLTDVDIRITGEVDNYSISGRLTNSVNADGTIKTKNNQDLVYTYDSSGLKQLYQSGITYEKYTASRKNMEDAFKNAYQNNSGRLGGIHFMNSSISMDHMIVAPKVLINGQPYTNYQMPENSIDFNLKSKGFINFFAALYFGGNSTFFSLNQIIRNSDNTIKEINHITEIYQNPSDKSLPYIYKYTNQNSEGYYYSNNSNTLPSGYQCIFYTSWIERPTLEAWDTSNYMTKLYYFEIPVNEGEYALGSVSGRDGGYLLYLDIGANAAAVDRTTITQEFKQVLSGYKYVEGIQILDANGTEYIDDKDSAVAVIAVSSYNNWELNINRSDNVIIFDKNLTSTYKGDSITLQNAVLNAIDSNTKITKVLKYMDYNRATDKLYETTVTNDGTVNTGYTVYKKDSTNGDTLIADQTTTDTVAATLEFGLLAIDSTTGNGTRVTNYTTVAVNTYSTDPGILAYQYTINTEDRNNIIDSFDMNIVRVTGTETITNVDTSINDAPATISITDGKTVIGTGNDAYTAEFVYKLAGDDITITSTITGDVVVTVTNASGSYTFTINDTQVTTGSTVTL